MGRRCYSFKYLMCLLVSGLMLRYMYKVDVVNISQSESQGINHLQREVRHKDDGLLVRVAGDHGELFLYSAFWDDRWSVHDGPWIRVIAGIQVSAEKGRLAKGHQLQCHVYCENATDSELHSAIAQSHVQFGPNRHVPIRNPDFVYGRFIVTCDPIRCNKYHTLHQVSLEIVDTKDSRKSLPDVKNKSVPVEFPEKPASPSDVIEFGTCHPVAYGHLNPYRLVEWFEMQKLLGIGKVVMYNDTLDDESSKVLFHYEREGFLDIRQTRSVKESDIYDKEDYGLRMGISTSDCLYRNMYRFRYIVSTDADELIMPRAVKTLPELVEIIQKKQMKGTKHRVGSFNFRNINFPADPGLGAHPDEGKPFQTHFLRYRKRQAVSRPGYHVKCIVDTMGCLAFMQHHCKAATDAYKEPELDVDWKLGALHHYRGTMCDMKKEAGLNCSDPQNHVLKDDHMLQYETDLVTMVDAQLKKLDMEPIA